MRQSPILLDQSFLSAGPGSVRLDMPIGTDVVFENLGTTGGPALLPEYRVLADRQLRLFRPTAVEVVASGTLQAADDPTNSTWDLAQFHFHTPSEHRVNLAHADGEMHMVFKSAGRFQTICTHSSEGRFPDCSRFLPSHSRPEPDRCSRLYDRDERRRNDADA